jgi:hypothetical protein
MWSRDFYESWDDSEKLTVRQSPASTDVNTEAEGYGVEGCYQATTGEDTADWEDFVRAVVNCSVRNSVSATVICSYVLQGLNTSCYQSKPRL